MPFLPADAVKKHLALARAQPPGEHLAVVGEDLIGDAIAAKRLCQSLAYRPGGGSGNEPGRDTGAGVVVSACIASKM